jgi:predicted dehydrogenase
MDYTTESLNFRLKKAVRYIRLYGPARTLVKIRGQYHMKRRFGELPTLGSAPRGAHVGLIGCGNFAFSNIAYYLTKYYGPVLRGCMDVDIHRSASLAQRYGLAYYTDGVDKIFDDPLIDLVYVASNHASHADYAVKAIEAGKAVHIEKPHIVNACQLDRLCDAMRQHQGRVTLGFNRPHSRIGRTIAESLHSQTGAAMLNWFVAGHAIDPDHWYFHEAEGGRVLGNLCHWTDFVYQMVQPESRHPIRINPTRAERSDCDIAVTYTLAMGRLPSSHFLPKDIRLRVCVRLLQRTGETFLFPWRTSVI